MFNIIIYIIFYQYNYYKIKNINLFYYQTSIIYNEGELNIDGLEFYNRNDYEKIMFGKKIYKCSLVIM